MKKKIAFLINSMDCGGAQRVVSRLLGPLSDRYDVRLLMLNEKEEAYDVCVPKVYFSGKEKAGRIAYYLELIKIGKKLKAYIRDNHIEVVISFLNVPNLSNILFCKGAKNIISIRANMKFFDDDSLSNRLNYAICKCLFRKSDKALVPAMVLKKQLVDDFGLKDSNISVVYNPFNISDIEKKASRAVSSDISDAIGNHRYIVAMGRLDRQKGFYHLINVFNLLDDKEMKLVIIGDGSLRDRLGELVDSLGLKGRVLFTGQQQDPFNIIKNAYAYVMSSIGEGFPNALVEAMACGVPVISTDCISGPREILYEDADISREAKEVEYVDYGVLVPAFVDSEEVGVNDSQYKHMAEAIEKILKDSELRAKYAKKSLERASCFTFEKSVQGYVDIIES